MHDCVIGAVCVFVGGLACYKTSLCSGGLLCSYIKDVHYIDSLGRFATWNALKLYLLYTPIFSRHESNYIGSFVKKMPNG